MNTQVDNRKIENAALGKDYPQRQNGSHVVTGMGVHIYRLACLRGGIKLEAKGMKLSRGKSCTRVARDMFNLPRATQEELIALLEKEILEFATP